MPLCLDFWRSPRLAIRGDGERTRFHTSSPIFILAPLLGPLLSESSIATYVVFAPLHSSPEPERMSRTSAGSSCGCGRGVQVTKDTEQKWKRQAIAVDEPQQAASIATSRWSPSIASDEEVRRLLMEGSFPPALKYRIPLSREAFPAPLFDERVLHFDFFSCGLGFPLHPFVWGLLFFFGCRLHHLSPTGILHLANFITFCECYLGTPPPI